MGWDREEWEGRKGRGEGGRKGEGRGKWRKVDGGKGGGGGGG